MIVPQELAVATEGLGKLFGDVEAVRSIDLEVPRHSIFGFLGPNGAGKTTTLRMLVGLLTPSRGRGTVLGHDITGDTLELRRRIGYLPQQPRFYPDLTARETLRFAGRFFYQHGPALERRIADLIEASDLSARADRPVGAFSGGERQRLGIAQAQLHSPDLLILDEPAAGLIGMLQGFLWIASQANESGIRLEEPAVGVADVFPQYLGLAILLSTIGVVVLTQGAMLDERRQGTLEWVLAKPVSRTGIVLAKFLAHAVPVLVVFVVFPWSGIYWTLSQELGSPWPLGDFLAVAGMVSLVLLFTLALTMALGTWTSSRAVVVGVPIAAGLMYDAIHLFARDWAGRLPFPWELAGSSVQVAAGQPLISMVPVVAAVIWIGIVLGLTVWRFGRDDAI